MARECELLACDIATKAEFRDKFHDLAVKWRKLAAKFDQLECRTLH